MKLNWQGCKIPNLKAHHNSDAEHSVFVVMGAHRSDGTVMPARDFLTDAVLNTPLIPTNSNLRQIFIEYNEKLHESIKDSILSTKWEWDRTTYRKNGEIVDSPRNIIDTGELLDSQSWEII